MASIVLIHGAFHGGWCWDHLVPHLEAKGHTVAAPDMPSNGSDPMPAEEVGLDDYVARVGEVLSGFDEKVLLVGHSLGGATITQAGENFSEQIAGLVYLTAAIPANGQCRADLTEGNEDSLLGQYRQTSEDGKTFTVDDEGIAPCFYNDCSEEMIAWAKSKLVPQAMSIFTTPVATTDSRWGSLRRAYVFCSEDNAIRPDGQRAMMRHHPCDPVIDMATSHSPFMSQPEALAGHLDAIARQWNV